MFKKDRLLSAHDAVWLDSLHRQEQVLLKRRNEYMGRYSEIIFFNYGRGMSRKTLVDRYGEAAVALAIGVITPIKGTDECLVEKPRPPQRRR